MLAIDNGTQSVRALLFDLSGNLLAKARSSCRPITPASPAGPSRTRIITGASWGSLPALWAQTGIDRSLIRGVSLTTQRGTVINVDARGRRCGQPSSGSTNASASQRADQGPWGWLFKLVGAEATVDYFRAQAEANWIAQHQPDIWAATDKFLLLSGFSAIA
ncbi:hypothetical protein JTY93_23615 [Pseudomonas hygromyciniae]|uniref:Carbohydrate kinase FGGY N-terminal domain-containing protein n=1 Tax=Pseudomonas hygromyciniae TaxID=2812000 RepID=A0ABX7JZL0_9PSED|nr:FGGY family carbohydrate kinase [Pseudomonas hygromyciniae]QSB39171.1 hypothetical protein JTY93_23615 [Pseudomonas hygromyciniae]